MIITAATADLLLAFGALIGLTTRIYALIDEDTVWTRTSSGINVITYPFTALLPFAVLGLWYTFTISFLKFLVWIGIYIFRAPENENLLGRVNHNEKNSLHNNQKRQNKTPAQSHRKLGWMG